jgi:hypothetical protein
MVFDGKTLTLLGKDANLFAKVEEPGTIDQLVDTLRDKYHRPVPAADLLLSDPYGQLMPLVVDTKDLGSGVIRGVECDHLAFRTEEVDWQIWIAQGERPYPCRYVITSTKVTGSPQYTIDVRSWKTGDEVAPDSFSLEIPQGAKEISMSCQPFSHWKEHSDHGQAHRSSFARCSGQRVLPRARRANLGSQRVWVRL